MRKYSGKYLPALALVILLLTGCGGGTARTTASDGAAPEETAETAGEAVGETGETTEAEPVEGIGIYTAVIEVENYGTITAELDGDTAPITVANFVSLAESGFYDGLTFHRIMDGFMIQGGDPLGSGFGGSDTNIRGEFAANGVDNPISHVRGTLSMARGAYDYDSASSQFFIVQTDSLFLDGQYAAFGHVTEGMEVVDAICADAVPLDDNGTIAPEDQPVMRSVTVHEGPASG
ncbi:MAG: peptidylprolyl isomerase [Oscillibacter sp.]|nr:peptidylprolyl isomerase [Oscillibacter sp.]